MTPYARAAQPGQCYSAGLFVCREDKETTMNTKRVTLVLGVALGLLASGTAQAIPISNLPAEGLVINKTGTYELTQDLSWPKETGTAIRITASHVLLDLGGHTLAAKPTQISVSFGIGVGSAVTNVTIRNGT